MNYHPYYYYPPLDVDHGDHDHGQQIAADEVEEWGGPAPPSPFVVYEDPLLVGGQLTPPPSPSPYRATQPVDPHAPCPATPQFVPSSVDFDELQWTSSFNVGNAVAGPSTSGVASTAHLDSSVQSNFMPLGELNHYTSFAAPATHAISNNCGYPAQHGAPSTGGNDYDGFEALYQALLLRVPIPTPTPNPIMMIIKRAQLDQDGSRNYPLTTIACGSAFGMFDMTCGRPAPTGNDTVDTQTLQAVQELQNSLANDWSMALPKPIPAVLIRLNDIVGPYDLCAKEDGFAYVVPTEDSIWGTILERGIDSKYRPIANPNSISITTDICVNGSAIFHPEHIVASRFAVNVFFEVPVAQGQELRAEYIGAYVLKVDDEFTIDRSAWQEIAPEIQQMVYDRAPHLFDGLEHPSRGSPDLPLVDFVYYKWDDNVVGLADSIDLELKFRAVEASIALREAAGIVDDEDEDLEYDDGYYSESTSTRADSDSGFDTDSGSEVDEDDEDDVWTPITDYSTASGKAPLEDLLARQT